MRLLIEQDQQVYDLSNAAMNIAVTSNWRAGAAKLSFQYLKSSMLEHLKNGSYVTFEYQSEKVFAGRIFQCQSSEEQVIEIIAYDQLRYLKNKDTIMRKSMTLSELLHVIAANQQLRVGSVADTKIKLGDYLYDNQSYLDMIYKGINDNLVANGYMYHLYDNFGAIELTDLLDLRLPLMLGERSGVTKFSYQKSIDQDTFTQIKLIKDNQQTGRRDAYLVKDSQTIKQYGLLQYYEKVNENMNAAQIKERAERLIKLKNHETETLKIGECLGDVRIRGGSGIKLQILSEGIDTWTIVDQVTHKFGATHEMSLDLVFARG